jgi:hypothetical protein
MFLEHFYECIAKKNQIAITREKNIFYEIEKNEFLEPP